jgi:RNA recognition motif-containing protein
MLTLVIRGLPRSMSEGNLEQLFSSHGKVFGLKLAKDLFSGECKGYAELQMEGHAARAAITALNGTSHDGGLLQVGLHDPKRANRGRR